MIKIHEIKKASSEIKLNRTSVEDQIIPELIKYRGEILIKKLKILLNKCINDPKILTKMEQRNYKTTSQKRRQTQFQKYRQINLLRQVYKLLIKIITNRLVNKFKLYHQQLF